MALKIEIITRFILTIGLIFIILKYIGPILFSFFWNMKNKKQSNTDNDLGYLIKAQEKKISGLNNIKNKDSGSKNITKFHKSIKNQLSKDQQNKIELEKILEFIDNSKWGEGPHLSRLYKEIHYKDKTLIDSIDINKNIKFLLGTDYYFENSKIKPNLHSIFLKTKLYVFLDYIITFSTKGSSKSAQENLAKELKTSSSSLICSIYMFTTNDGQKTLFSNILGIKKNPSTISKHFTKIKTKQALLNFISKTKIRSINEVKSQLKENIFTIDCISPLPSFNQKSKIEDAYHILGISQSASKEQVKKAYQTLAKQKHPDMLKSKGVPESFDSIANNNFTILKNAYDMIKKNQ